MIYSGKVKSRFGVIVATIVEMGIVWEIDVTIGKFIGE